MNVGEWISKQIKEKNVTKSSIYQAINMTAKGFDVMLERDTVSVNNFIKICKELRIDPKSFFGNSIKNYEETETNEMQVSEPETKYNRQEQSETEYLREQLSKMTEIVKRLTETN